MRFHVPTLSALLAGCAPTIVAWPPPAALPTALDPVEAGRVEVGGGASTLVLVGDGGLGVGAITTGHGLVGGVFLPVASASVSGQFDVPGGR